MHPHESNVSSGSHDSTYHHNAEALPTTPNSSTTPCLTSSGVDQPTCSFLEQPTDPTLGCVEKQKCRHTRRRYKQPKAKCDKRQLAEPADQVNLGSARINVSFTPPPRRLYSQVAARTCELRKGDAWAVQTQAPWVIPTGLPQSGGGSDEPATLAVPAARLPSLNPVLEENRAPALESEEPSLISNSSWLSQQRGQTRATHGLCRLLREPHDACTAKWRLGDAQATPGLYKPERRGSAGLHNQRAARMSLRSWQCQLCPRCRRTIRDRKRPVPPSLS